jgi:hypothetical protein
MFGVDTTDDDGNEFPDEMFYTAIASAVGYVESTLSVVLKQNKRVREERHDVRSWEGDTYYLQQLDWRPILHVNEAAIRFASFQPSILPDSWIHVVSEVHGQLQIMPGPEGLEGFSFSGGVPILGIDVLVPREYTPGWFQYDYTAGWEHDITGTVAITDASTQVTGTGTLFTEELEPLGYIKIAGETRRVISFADDTTLTVDTAFTTTATDQTLTYLAYPSAILNACGLLASMLPFDTAGDLIIGAGISSLSISMDGISQSIQTTSGVENSGYGARLNQYKERFHSLMHDLKGDYKTTRVLFI